MLQRLKPNFIFLLSSLFFFGACSSEDALLKSGDGVYSSGRITTDSVFNISGRTAKISARFSVLHDFQILQSGFCWSTESNPDIYLKTKTIDSSGSASMTSRISGLMPGTTYFIRAYARYSDRVEYGNQLQFITSPQTVQAGLPDIKTMAVTGITTAGAKASWEIFDEGADTVFRSGLVWSTSPNPDTSSPTKTSENRRIGFFESAIGSLSPNTTYYLRMYAQNSVGIAYGNQLVFQTAPLTVSDIDGNVYETVAIGDQVWMKQNLRVSRFRNGDPIPLVSDSAAWAAIWNNGNPNPLPAFCYFQNKPANDTLFGKLYNIYVLADPRGLCPAGWRLPESGPSVSGLNAGIKMKAVSPLWMPSTAANTGTNESGFSGLPGGSRDQIGKFIDSSMAGSWWTTATLGYYPATSNSFIQTFQLRFNRKNQITLSQTENAALSVRCIRK